MKLPFLALLLGTALRVSAAEPPFDVRLVEPAAGTRVVAGSTALLEWDALATPANVDEWEAFISVDGGRTYLSRITPHLDATIHRFRFTVPNLPGAEITVLLRFGDEDEERRFVFPARLRISGVALSAAPAATGADAEPFDVHEEGATSWTEGSRDGSSLRSIVLGGAAMSSGRAELQTPLRDRSAVALSTGGSHSPIGDAVVASATTFARSRRREPRTDPRFVSDILLMSRRRNI